MLNVTELGDGTDDDDIDRLMVINAGGDEGIVGKRGESDGGNDDDVDGEDDDDLDLDDNRSDELLGFG